MRLIPEQAEQILEDLVQEYKLDENNNPYDEYISLLAILPTNPDGSPSDEPEGIDKYFYISIGLTKELPDNLTFPNQYKGMRVTTRITSGAKAH